MVNLCYVNFTSIFQKVRVQLARKKWENQWLAANFLFHEEEKPYWSGKVFISLSFLKFIFSLGVEFQVDISFPSSTLKMSIYCLLAYVVFFFEFIIVYIIVRFQLYIISCLSPHKCSPSPPVPIPHPLPLVTTELFSLSMCLFIFHI